MMRVFRRAHLVAAALLCALAASDVRAEVLFESGTLGPTGISWNDLISQTVLGTSVGSSFFPGVRFELTQPVITSQVGGHFVAPSNVTFFGAIVALDDANDFPNSNYLSTPDVLGVTKLDFPNPSAEVFGDLTLHLNPGWYALVFGSDLFGTSGFGGAVRNGTDVGDPTYIAYGTTLNSWFNLDILALPFDNHRFVVLGQIVPEPNSATLALSVIFAFSIFFARCKRTILRR